MPNAFAAARDPMARSALSERMEAARTAAEHERMTHSAFAPPEELTRARKWLTGPVATDDYGNEIPRDSSSLLSMLNSLTPHPGQSEEQIAENTLGFMLPSGGLGAARDLARGVVPESVVRIYAGMGAKTADRNALRQAWNMEEAGADNEAVRAATGWFQGPDRKWRFEIDDSGSAALPRSIEQAAQLERGEKVATYPQGAMEHPQLSAAYPDTKEISVTLDPALGEAGLYNRIPISSQSQLENIRVGIEPDYSANRSTMLHELQHAIQERENFARGGTPENALIPFYDEMNKKMAVVVKEMDKHAVPGQWRKFKTPEGYKLAEEYDRLMQAKMSADPYEAYRKLAGEVEARDVQARMDYTPEQRKVTPPYSSQGIAPEEMTVNFRR